MPDIVITEFMDELAVAGLAHDHNVLYDSMLVDDEARLPAVVADARAVIVRNRTQVNEALLAAGRLGVGLDTIDLAAGDARNVDVYSASGTNTGAVAEYVIAALLLLVRGAVTSTERLAAGEWPRTELAGGEIAGRRLALVGYGGIARLVAATTLPVALRWASASAALKCTRFGGRRGAPTRQEADRFVEVRGPWS